MHLKIKHLKTEWERGWGPYAFYFHLCFLNFAVSAAILEPRKLSLITGSGRGGPDPVFPLLFHENPVSRTFFIAILNFVFSFPKMHEKRLISAKAGPFD